MVIRQAGVDGVEIWGLDRKREDGKTRGEISKVGYGTEQQNSRLHGKRGVAKKDVEGERQGGGRGGLKEG